MDCEFKDPQMQTIIFCFTRNQNSLKEETAGKNGTAEVAFLLGLACFPEPSTNEYHDRMCSPGSGSWKDTEAAALRRKSHVQKAGGSAPDCYC